MDFNYGTRVIFFNVKKPNFLVPLSVPSKTPLNKLDFVTTYG